MIMRDTQQIIKKNLILQMKEEMENVNNFTYFGIKIQPKETKKPEIKGNNVKGKRKYYICM